MFPLFRFSCRWKPVAFLCLSGFGARAQEAPATAPEAPRMPLVVGAYAQGSIIMAHTYAIRHLVASHPTGFEINLQRQTTGAAPWHGWYKFPKIGLALTYYDFHNPVLGYAFAASPYISKSFSRGEKHDFSFRLGTGLAYLTNPYNQETNHKNTIASSALNATLQLRFEYDYALTPHLGLLAGIGLNHFSNGATTKPNFGVNLPSLVLGLNYHEQRHPVQVNPYAPAPEDVGHMFYNVSTSLGFKQRTEGDKQKYLVNSVTLAVGRRMNRKSNLLLGVEGFNDRSLKATLNDTTRAGLKQPDVKKAGVFIGHELLFGRLAFDSHLGFYVYAPYKSSTPYYERLGLKYHFTDLLFGAIDLKIHRGAADVIEFKVGAKL
ncbi:acyloxyacyl hydrolase [Hymenobacter sp. 5317J-9]|uniref:acyloxyacyl hydrolase n=1 Tax=Hymenobacter sp. 5317J-9 TaxID=2932250 RepID=UPI001FD6A689|nr:acyloxyacyl hydrolase [Hymenobacter sp. 5317J-9]UOQ97518.1 acyloxyacyl hydrolase [Hymenobacter sp. 5317J-9]